MLIPVILSGGAGSRLWPVSREAYPKPFIRLADGKSLLRRTFERAARIDNVNDVVTVTNREYYFLNRDEYVSAQLGPRATFLLEPRARNTAPAVAMAAFLAAEKHGAGALLLVLPADHLIEDENAFVQAVNSAAIVAKTGALVTFGIKPARPETGYGYIEAGPDIGTGAVRVARFVEKPSAETAAQFIASGRFYWNSGMFCFGAGTFLDALQVCAPELHHKAKACWDASTQRVGDKIELDQERFGALPDISVDYAVMEKHGNVAMVKAGFDWNDIGSWSALGELTAADAQGNRIQGEAVVMDAHDCYIQSDSRMVAAVGIKNLVVVDTPDALLVADKARVQEVKKVAQQLKLTNHSTHLLHRTAHRPWGTYTVLEEGPCYKIKRIVVKPGAVLSLQMHHHRSEHWVVLSGTATVVNDTKQYTVRPNESTFIPVGHKHRLENTGNEDLVIIEVQAGSYVGEDDIVRFEDVYGRTGTPPVKSKE